jgi:hypothetical protein
MPVLVATFRRLLNEAEPGLEEQLHSIGFSPAHCAIQWMVTGFVNVLDVEEVCHSLYQHCSNGKFQELLENQWRCSHP